MFQQHTAALTVSWPCSLLCRTAQVHVWGSAAGLRWERGSPRGPGQMVQSLEQMLTARAHSLSFGQLQSTAPHSETEAWPSVALT
ncbi:hypothetical protein PBY51_010501 [Eleginops maclovinus]|uniref:Uncharacterized protein n=1 Tax=Eleginops maclovinus TaxID=56733 RepID=A0AAN7XAX0_ELEMC|nr:hypothetical protein PBY51_010501 [Eleginops maclovinus]